MFSAIERENRLSHFRLIFIRPRYSAHWLFCGMTSEINPLIAQETNPLRKLNVINLGAVSSRPPVLSLESGHTDLLQVPWIRAARTHRLNDVGHTLQ